MKLEDLQDAESYIYIKVLARLANRFKEGDYVTISELDYPDDGDMMIWSKSEHVVDGFRSRLDSAKNFNIFFTPVYKITKYDDGYLETEAVNPLAGSEYEDRYCGEISDVTGYSLRSCIEDFICDLDYSETDAEMVIKFFADGYIKLDDDYADSIIFESSYVPYKNCEDIKEMFKKLELAYELEQKELLRQRALKGHATRKRKKELAEKHAKLDARKASALLKAKRAEVKRINKTVNNKTKKKK